MYYNPDIRKFAKAEAKTRVMKHFSPSMLVTALYQLPGLLLSLVIMPLFAIDALTAQLQGMLASGGADAQISLLTGELMSRLGGITAVSLLLSIFVTGPLYMGFKRYQIRLMRDEPTTISDVVFCFTNGHDYVRALQTNLWILARTFAWGLVLIVAAMALLMVLMLVGMFGLVIWFVLYLLGMLMLLGKVQSYEGAYILLHDDAEMRPGAGVRGAAQYCKKHLLDLIMFVLSFLLWSLVLGLPGGILTYMGMQNPEMATIFLNAGSIVSAVLGLFVIVYTGTAFVRFFEEIKRSVDDDAAQNGSPIHF